MKNYSASEFRTALKNLRGTFLLTTGLASILFSCSEVHLEELSRRPLDGQQHSASAQEVLASVQASGTSITEIKFSATAVIAYCYGENIMFTGTIENRVSKTTDAEGVTHYSRSFNTRGMTGVGTTSGTQFDVLGGAEMFAIKDPVFTNGSLNLAASLSESDIVIHQGTLVFKSRTDGSRVVARHTIRKVPGLDDAISKWECQGN